MSNTSKTIEIRTAVQLALPKSPDDTESIYQSEKTDKIDQTPITSSFSILG